MAGPGVYIGDSTEGIHRVDDLPKPIVEHRSRNFPNRPCPRCGRSSYRLRTDVRTLHDLGNLDSGRPRELSVLHSQHRCRDCNCYFNADMTDLAPPKAKYTHRVMDLAIRTVVQYGLPYAWASESLWFEHRVFVPAATIQNWVEAAGKKGARPDPGRLPG